jgi:carbon storage regulator CsrA
MLVLSRRLHEKLILPEVEAAIQVVAIQPASVRLGIEAPSSLSVVREEIYGSEPPTHRSAAVGAADPASTLDRMLAHLVLLEKQLGPNPGAVVRETLEKLSRELAALRRDLDLRSGKGRPTSVRVCP